MNIIDKTIEQVIHIYNNGVRWSTCLSYFVLVFCTF